MPIRPEASQALADLVSECGATIIKMPSSGQLYISTRLSRFPEEKELFNDALRRGIPDRILMQKDGAGRGDQLAAIAREFAASKGVDLETARGVVSAWAEALNPGSARPDKRSRAPAHDPLYFKQRKGIKFVMAAISGAGGFIGAALGAGLPNLIVMYTEFSFGEKSICSWTGHKVPMALAFWVTVGLMLVTGLLAGSAALFGWLFGGGDELPWSGFSAACGAGFATALVSLAYIRTPIQLVLIACCVFGATYTASTRGGHKFDRRV